MAFKKTLAERLFKISRISPNQSLANCRISSSTVRTQIPQSKANIAPDPGDNAVFRRSFHKKAAVTATAEYLPKPFQFGGNLMEKLRAFDIVRERVRLDGLFPPPVQKHELTIQDARKLLRVARLEMVKSRLGDTERNWMPRSEFVRICEEVYSDPEEGNQVARTLDESGTVIVLGDAVFLKPKQVVKAIGGLIPFPATNPNDPRKKELEQLEQRKALIDERARTQVRRELWGGLGYLVVQTAAFMRLTFWELSWDVMEPICFYVTSIYVMAGYAFFLRTSREPTFEGFFQSRFLAKQRKLMKNHKFDLERYNELRKVCYPFSEEEDEFSFSSSHSEFDGKVNKIC
ncbi:Calcium uniporter protein 2, mitochondrial [Linum perenne]